MQIFSTYSVKIKHYNHIFKETVEVYRSAVDFFLNVCLEEWNNISAIKESLLRQQYVERLCHKTKANSNIRYDFDAAFYKFPSYQRRSAINEAIGKISSYKSNLTNWETNNPASRGKAPSPPRTGYVYPCMYRTAMYEPSGLYTAKLKVFIRNTWDWIYVSLRKGDIDYITRRCSTRKQCAPILRKRGKEWFLDFPFEEYCELNNTDICDQTIAAVDLGINSAATVAVMRADGTVIGRHFLSLSNEKDRLSHAVNRIKKAQQHGSYKTPRLWARAKGINNDIAVKTAQFIIDTAVMYNADVIVFEHLDLAGKKHGSKKQKLHLWRAKYVQEMVTNKAHRLSMRISRICAWGTSKYAFDGSGVIARGKDAGFKTYSLCRFPNGKVYNCDLSAAYNIGSRYLVRELVKSLPATVRLEVGAKIPGVSKRSTCTLSTLFSLNAALAARSASVLSSGCIVETLSDASKGQPAERPA